MATVKECRMRQERYDELKHELEYSKTTRADEIAELIKEARGFGDLSENSEYDEAKNEQGKWEQVPYYTIEDNLPYGHGEKSVYIISAYMRLTRDEAFAIRYHMGFSANDDPGNVGKALEMFPLAYALCAADMEAAYFCEGSPKK